MEEPHKKKGLEKSNSASDDAGCRGTNSYKDHSAMIPRSKALLKLDRGSRQLMRLNPRQRNNDNVAPISAVLLLAPRDCNVDNAE